MTTKSKKKNTPVSQSFLKGAMILTVSMLVVKACGLFQKVLLTNLYSTLGENYGEFGSGLFANAYELYVPLYTLATVGFPIAVSRMVSVYSAQKRYADVKATYKLSLPLFVIMGSVCFLLMVLGSFWYVDFIDSPYSQLSVIALAPTVFFGCLVSVYRGYFEGLRNMTPTAVSEIIEAFVKIGVGVTASYLVIKLGLKEYSAYGTVFTIQFSNTDEAFRTLLSFSVAASIAGITLGSVLSFLYLRIRYVVRKGDLPDFEELVCKSTPKSEIFSSMLRCALPVGIGALVLSFANSFDAAILNRILKSMVANNPEELIREYPALRSEIQSSVNAHTCIWGYYSSCLTVLSIVLSVTQVFGTSAMPNVTNAFTKGDKSELKTSIETVLRFTAVFGFPAGIGLCVLSKPVLELVFFANPNISLYGYPVLQMLSVASVFIGLCTPICAMLQGIGKAKTTMMIYVFGTVFKVVLSIFFSSNVKLNICGAALASVISDLLMCFCALYNLIKSTSIRLDYASVFLKPLLSSAVCALFAGIMCYLVRLNVMISVVISAIIYLVFLFILHTFKKEELKMLLNSKKIVIILEKLHLLG